MGSVQYFQLEKILISQVFKWQATSVAFLFGQTYERINKGGDLMHGKDCELNLKQAPFRVLI